MSYLPSRRTLLLITVFAAAAFLAIGSRVWAAPRAQGNDPNAECLACHSIPNREIELTNGDKLNLHVDAATFRNSVHGQQNFPCTACHTNISGFPHQSLIAFDRRDYQLDRYSVCRKCHPDQYESTLDSMHTQALAGGNRSAAMCTDCHGAHDITDPTTPRQQISLTCSKCHSSIYEQYKESVHGAALLDESNPDVPTCIDCHGVHSIKNPTTAAFRLKSPEICGNCHRDEAKMAKYGVSTAVFNTYVADFHGTTVTLFERESPDQPTNKAVCFDCHGVHNIKAVNDPDAKVVKANLLPTCQRCHPDADANFPTSWTSHFIPDKDHNPLVYYINLFYAIIIPGLLSFMAAFVGLDFLRRTIHRFRHRKHTEKASA